jgi:tetratricopeptide (TPR) repeat protein
MTTKSLYPLIIIVILVFGINFNTLFHDFVYDDKVEVIQNHWMRDIKYSSEIFSSSSWGFAGRETNYYRPMIHMIRMMNYHIFGLAPWGFHLINIAFHAGISVLVFLIASRLLKRIDNSFFSPHFIAAALFATHPVHTEQVAWVSSIAGLTYTLFYLLSFYLYVESTSKGWIKLKVIYFLSVSTFFIAALSKEMALTLPFVLITYDYVLKKSPLFSCLKRSLPYLAVAGVYFILRFHALGGFAPVKGHTELSNFVYFINVFPIFAEYLKKLILPLNLNVYHVFHPVASVFEPKAIISIFVTLVFLFASYISYKKNREAFFGFSIIVITLLPALYIPALGKSVFSERYIYLPSFGFVLLVSTFFAWVKVNRPKWAIAAATGFIVLTGLYSIGTISRNTVWKNDYSLWTDAVKKSPDGSVPHNSLGWASYEKGLTKEAVEHFYTALKIDPNHAEANNNLGVVYGDKGLEDKAMEQFQIAIKLRPDYADAHNNIGIAYGRKGWFTKAENHFQVALRLKPGFADAHQNMAVTYMNMGAIDEAIARFKVALDLKPDAINTHLNIANAYEMKGMAEKANAHLLKAKSLKNR